MDFKIPKQQLQMKSGIDKFEVFVRQDPIFGSLASHSGYYSEFLGYKNKTTTVIIDKQEILFYDHVLVDAFIQSYPDLKFYLKKELANL